MDQDHKPPVLISSAGRRAALLAAFREAGAGVVHACDLNPDLSAACRLADAAHAVPRCDAPGFVEAVEAIVRDNGIRLVVPTIDTELPAYAEAAGPLDEVVEDKGVTVLIDPKAVLFLIGTEIDYETTRLSSKFVFNNPNQTDACGCGESVTIVPAAALDT